jgi:hypothetical protein
MAMNQIGEPTKHRITVNGHNLKATVYITWDYEHEPIEGSVDFGSEEADREYYQRFYDGELQNVWISVKAYWQGAEGFDSLGGCHVKASGLETDVVQIVAEYSMVEQALDSLKKQIQTNVKLYAPLSKRERKRA